MMQRGRSWGRAVWGRIIAALAVLAMCLSMSTRPPINVGTGVLHGPPKEWPRTFAETVEPDVAIPPDKVPWASPTRVVLSCLYVTPSFYRSGRSVPPLDWVVVFLNSAAHNIKGDALVVLFVDAKTQTALMKFPDVAALVASEFLNMTVVPERYLALPLAVNISNAANNFRFALFRDWMEQRRSEGTAPDSVMISDVTDVYFQSDPFEGLMTLNPSRKDLVVFTLEDASRDLGNEKYNKRWLSCYGPDVLKAVKGKRISCAGATIGRFNGMLGYAAMQVDELSKPSLLECSRHHILAALDQATHNYILHVRMKLATTSSDIVFHGNFGKPTWDVNRRLVLAPSGKPYPVVHQYTSNRHPEIMAVAKALWGADKDK